MAKHSRYEGGAPKRRISQRGPRGRGWSVGRAPGSGRFAVESTWPRRVGRKSDEDGRSEARQEATIRAGCGGSPSMWERPGVGGLQRSLRASSMHNDGDGDSRPLRAGWRE